MVFFAICAVCEFYHSVTVDDRDLAALGVNESPIFKHLECGGNAGAPGAKHGRQKCMRQVLAREVEQAGVKMRLELAMAVAELERLKAQAKILGETAQSARTSIVRRVFNDSLNKL